jgi:hypothetical protein
MLNISAFAKTRKFWRILKNQLFTDSKSAARKGVSVRVRPSADCIFKDHLNYFWGGLLILRLLWYLDDHACLFVGYASK